MEKERKGEKERKREKVERDGGCGRGRREKAREK